LFGFLAEIEKEKTQENNKFRRHCFKQKSLEVKRIDQSALIRLL